MNTKESTILELKQSWQDSHLSTIAAFANSDGGTLCIGIDDSGRTVGIVNSKKLLEDLPNKILSKLGIIANVRLDVLNGKDTIRIRVDKIDVPISHNGRYYKRTGSTTQELNGKELTRFLISKLVSSWDEYPVPNSTISEIALATLERFRQLARNRLPLINADIEPSDFLAKLNLMEGTQIRRAGILLFGNNLFFLCFFSAFFAPLR